MKKNLIFIFLLISFLGFGRDVSAEFAGGNGTQASPYQIATCQQLQDIQNSLSSWYVLTQDVDCSDTVNWNEGEGFNSIGTNGSAFQGTLNGAGYKVSNLTINNPSDGEPAVFGAIGSGGVVEYVNFENITITETDGSAAGVVYDLQLGGIVRYVSVSGNITGGEAAGIANAIRFGSELYDSYVINMNLTGIFVSAGIAVSVGSESSINRTYAVASHGGSPEIKAGIVGYNNASVIDSFYDQTISGAISDGGGTPKTTAEMQTVSTFTSADWDFDTVWNSSESYPYLRIPPVVEPETIIEPVDVFSIGTHSATLQGHVENLTWEGDEGAVVSYYFIISTDPEVDGFAAGPVSEVDESGNFTTSATDGGGQLLTCDTTYYVKAYVRVDTDIDSENPVILLEKSSTNTISFTTNDCPSVELDDITNITKTGATLRARVQNKDWNGIDSEGFFSFSVDKSEDFSSEDQIYIEVESIDDLGYFSADIPTDTPLECGTTYYVMAQLNSRGTVDGLSWIEYYQDTSSFTTADCKTAAKKRSVGGYASPTYLAQQGIVLEQSSVIPNTTTQCPVNQLLTQNLKAPSRNGVYNTYTKAIVTQAHILQAHLNRLGFNSGKEDGILGPISTGAIKRMQTFLKTTPDGYVGPITRGLLNNSCGTEGLKKI